ncbi:conserved hypothetical protein [Magnetospirillum sp. SS-4]|nr:conserved hypothetical protein [Magnetospirillum sp. SS-4]
MGMSSPDALYHLLFSHPLMVEQLVREFVPEAMAVGLNFAGMERVNAKFHDRDGKRREGDVIWRMPTSGGDDVFLYIMCEFQSSVDWWMAVRTQVYEGLLWQHVIAEKKMKPGDYLPPVLMLVLYNGEQRWSAPVETAALVALPTESPLWPWQPQVRYHLLDMGAVPEEELAIRDSLAALLFRLEHPHEPEELAHLVDEVVGWFRRYSGYDDLKRLFTELVRQAIEGYEPSVAVPGDMMEMRSMLANLGETWKKRWVAEGEAKGEASALIRLTEKRFGPLPADLRARILAADAASIEAWLDRLMEAPSIETLFSATN